MSCKHGSTGRQMEGNKQSIKPGVLGALTTREWAGKNVLNQVGEWAHERPGPSHYICLFSICLVLKYKRCWRDDRQPPLLVTRFLSFKLNNCIPSMLPLTQHYLESLWPLRYRATRVIPHNCCRFFCTVVSMYFFNSLALGTHNCCFLCRKRNGTLDHKVSAMHSVNSNNLTLNKEKV